MSSVAIVYFSGYGHTKRMAVAVAQGVTSVPGLEAHLVAISPEGEIGAEDWDAIGAAQGVIFGSPTYMGGAAWQFKRFADASSKVWFSLGWKDKIAAGFTNSASMNGDKFSTIQYFITLAMQHGMIWVGTGLMPANAKAAKRDDINYVAGFSGALAQTPADASVEEMLPGDLATAEIFGARVATVAMAHAAALAPPAAS
jgi:NAD(P)H dehydrogenase (quinone)